MSSVYLASPLGFTLPTKVFYDEVLLPAMVARGMTVLDPWAESAEAFAHAFDVGTDAALLAANGRAGAANERLLRTCDAVFAVLDGVDVDSGTAAEIGFAAALRKPIIGWRSDFRQAGDNSQSLVNLQVEHFIASTGGRVHTDLGEALDALDAVR